MKKTILLTLLLLGIVKAEDNFFSLNKTTVDLAKNEQIQVQYTEGFMTHISTEYRLYTADENNLDGFDNKVYLDIEMRTGPAFLEPAYIDINIPVNLSVLDDFVYPIGSETQKNIELIVNLYIDGNSEIIKTDTFEITIINTNSSGRPDLAIADPSGAWFQQGLPGTWFSITQYSNGSGVLYTGHKDGQPLWLMSNIASDAWVEGVPKTFEMYVAGNDDSLVSWGSLQLQFNGCNTGLATLTGSNSTQTFELTKLALPVNANCVEK